MNRLWLAGLLLVSVAAAALADEGDDTLRFYLAKSKLVVLGEITSMSGADMTELGVLGYMCEFRVEDVLLGDEKLKGAAIKVRIIRFGVGEKDHLPLLEKGQQCILFLKPLEQSSAEWITADFWFGVQYPSPWMARSLKRLAAGRSTN